jgi:hypothetical protein
MNGIPQLISILQEAPSLIEAVSFRQLILFIDITTHLRPLMEYRAGLLNPYIPPLWLDVPVVNFLVDAVSSIGEAVSSKQMEDLWDIMSRYIWDLGYRPASKALLQVFLDHGTQHNIGRQCTHASHFPLMVSPGFVTIVPPTSICTKPACQSRRLFSEKSYDATLFTLENGPIPVFPLSRACPGAAFLFT